MPKGKPILEGAGLKSRTYTFARSNLTLTFGSITDSKAEVIVSSDDAFITMGGGVSASICLAGGEEIRRHAAKNIPAQAGDVIVTTAGRLPAKYIFHAITIGDTVSIDTDLSTAAILRKAVSKCFDLLDWLSLQSIAFPAIGAGAAGFAYEDVAVEMANIIAPRLSSSSRAIQSTVFLFDRVGDMQPKDFLRFFEEFDDLVPRRAAHATPVPAPLPAKSPAAGAPQDRALAKPDQATRTKVSVFISYAHEDEKPYLERLCEQLKALQRANLLDEWHDRDITAGADWRGEIDDHLNSARLILLLISPAFINSDYCFDLELKKALERHNAGEAITVPIIIRPCIWSILPFARLQVLPTDGKACTKWPDMDEAFLNVAERIRTLVESIVR